MTTTALGPFLGLITALDSSFTPDTAASDMLNYMVEDGTLVPAYGFRNLAAAQASFVAAYGLEYLQGYDSSTPPAEVEEYVSIEDVGGTVRPYSRSVTTGAATVITNSGAGVSLHASFWRGAAWQSTSYWVNPSDTNKIYKHTIGSLTSWTAFAPPTSPLAAPALAVAYGGNANNYARLSFATSELIGTLITCTGCANASASSVGTGGEIKLAHTGTIQRSSVLIDLSVTNAGKNGGSAKSFDWYDNDVFGINLSSGDLDNSLAPGITIDPNSIVVTLVNSDGSPLNFAPSAFDYQYQEFDVGFGFTMAMRVHFDGKTRSDWGAGAGTVANIALGQTSGKAKKLKIEYDVTGGSAASSYNFMRIYPIIIGGVEILRWNGSFVSEEDIHFSYSHYNSSTSWESGLSPMAVGLPSLVNGAAPLQNLKPFGTWLTLTGVNSASADNNRLYVQVANASTGALEWRRSATQADSTLAIPYRLSYYDRLGLTVYNNVGPFTLTGTKYCVPCKGFMLWAYKGGYQNLRYSRVGDPEKQAMDTDSPDDLNKGATFSMADNFGDEPENSFVVGDVIIHCGKNGLYAQQGDAPYALTPPRRVPSEQGVCGPLGCCQWVSDSGLPGVVFVSRNGDGVYFATVNDATDERSMRVDQLDASIRGQLITWLRDGQSLTSFDTCRVWVDQQRDALWIGMKRKALVLRRKSLVDGNRQWEKRELNLASSATLAYVSSSTKRRVRWVRSSGLFDENEYNSSSDIFITGSSRDGGQTMVTPFWTSKKFSGVNSRLVSVYLERDDLTETPIITGYCSRQTSGIAMTMAANASWVRFSHLQSGWFHQIKITGAETFDPIRRASFQRTPLGPNVKVA